MNVKTQEELIMLLHRESTLTRQEIAQNLGISMPTALQYTSELLEKQILIECSELKSTGGRRAKGLAINPDIAYAIGIDVGLQHVELLLTNYMGRVCFKTEFDIVFEDQPKWYHKLEEEIQKLIKESKLDKEKILCAGLSFPGIIDQEKDVVIRSHALNVEQMSLDRFRKAVPVPLVVDNDANCAGIVEWMPNRDSFLYVSLNQSVGGAIIQNGNIFYGDTMQAGEIGHMLLIPGGKRCYCGKKGCVDPYLTPAVLCTKERSLDEFFERLEEGTKEWEEWDEYLEHLAVLLSNLRMILNMDIVLGGKIGEKIEPYMNYVCEKVQKYDRFVRDVDYIFPCRITQSACARGAAYRAMKENMNRIIEE